MTQDELARHVQELHGIFGFRVESSDGTLNILTDTWRAVKHALCSQTGLTGDG